MALANDFKGLVQLNTFTTTTCSFQAAQPTMDREQRFGNHGILEDEDQITMADHGSEIDSCSGSDLSDDDEGSLESDEGQYDEPFFFPRTFICILSQVPHIAYAFVTK
jgi:hypothetical protein